MVVRLQTAKRSLQPLQLLCTGTAVAVLGQLVNNQAQISPNAQLLVLARYAFTFASALAMYAQEVGRKPASASSTNHANSRSTPAAHSKMTLLLLHMGILDLASYGTFNIGFAACGSALATVVLAAAGQLATAFISATVLHRRLTAKHIVSSAIVTAGLVLRSFEGAQLPLRPTVNDAEDSANLKASSSSALGSRGASVLCGVVFVVVSALLFSILGCMYEVLMSSDQGNRASQAHATSVISGVSLAATCAYQLLYSLPNWHQLVLEPIAASGHSGNSVLAIHAVYGLAAAVHNHVQVKLLGSHGAMTVGLVNALRASVVLYVSSWLFCSSVAHLCITSWKAASALVVTCGAARTYNEGLAHATGIQRNRHDTASAADVR